MATPTPPPRNVPDETVRALVGEFFEERKKESARAEKERARRPRPFVTVVAAVVCAAVWILPSFQVRHDQPPSAVRVEASARMTVFLAAQRILDYRRTHGALPMTLTDAGVDSAGLTYWRTTDSLFELRTIAAGKPIAFQSSMNPARFLGNTLQVLGGAK